MKTVHYHYVPPIKGPAQRRQDQLDALSAKPRQSPKPEPESTFGNIVIWTSFITSAALVLVFVFAIFGTFEGAVLAWIIGFTTYIWTRPTERSVWAMKKAGTYNAYLRTHGR